MTLIDDLRDCREFSAIVTDRIWNAFWRDKGVALSDIEAKTNETLSTASAFRVCLVAHIGDTFLGTASLIESDLDERPDLSPWLAALWVEPVARGQGIASKLIDAVVARAGHAPCLYLVARPAMLPFYSDRGWRVFDDTDYNGLRIMVHDALGTHRASRA